MHKRNNKLNPFLAFIDKEKVGSILLGISVILALIIANSPLAPYYYEILDKKLGLSIDGKMFQEHDILHWINDGLMAVFFFVVGLELKREFVGGELASPRQALLPIGAAIGGMVVPALIYIIFNYGTETAHGWGIPMATDIAFALGVLHLVGNRVPIGAKVFLAALAIVDDLGAVLVIALFYSSDITLQSLLAGLGFAVAMFVGNKMGVRNIFFYAILGICGVWLSFMNSGVHPTIAAVIAAFTIPADVILPEKEYSGKIEKLLKQFNSLDLGDKTKALSQSQLHILDNVKDQTNAAIAPLQRLEHALHPFVNLFVLPIFAFANAGVSLNVEMSGLFSGGVIPGVFLGLLVGKVVGVVGTSYLMKAVDLAVIPRGVNFRGMIGLGLLAGIGFTMSLFVTTLAFTNPEHTDQAKIGIFTASITAGIAGYWLLKKVFTGPPASES
ncbi:MAG TPA: Na+/H+ antiporter NhaA [Saprospiraceae bacterium]|nr:Na+/H+ antiporter NhaA [Saprospiraceae bacterium]